MLTCLAPHVRAEETALDPADRMVQSLSIMSQQDEAIGDIAYNTATVYRRGCKLVSVVNGVIAAFGVTDHETAAGLVPETLDLLVPGGKRSKRSVNMDGIPNLVDPVLRASQQEEYPNLAKTVGAYPGSVQVSQKQLSAQEVMDILRQTQTPSMFVGRMSVHPDWTDALQILTELHEMGMDDATLSLACAGAGTEKLGTPLRSGEYGHYLSVMFHVGSFMENGTVYVLDSLPRAIEGETFGRAYDLHAQYAFVRDSVTNAFNQNFYASRISQTVIKLSLTPAALETLRAEPEETALERRVKLFKPLVLFGSCVMLISLPAQAVQ
ncbi:MAG: hypothetical protein ACI4MM_08275 [Candidatus Ventricola sp.]